ncbi:uncharacterized protein LOC143034535 [Oratosquilla oratoria]|uniref:uncharacterized protein LOC143034535 n=1 Tax=Oratosquilla oratoria TaxID=337810 RepID=UPI003F768B3F
MDGEKNEELHKCPECKTPCASKKALRKHIKKIHGFLCRTCGKKFYGLYYLSVHQCQEEDILALKNATPVSERRSNPPAQGRGKGRPHKPHWPGALRNHEDPSVEGIESCWPQVAKEHYPYSSRMVLPCPPDTEPRQEGRLCCAGSTLRCLTRFPEHYPVPLRAEQFPRQTRDSTEVICLDEDDDEDKNDGVKSLNISKRASSSVLPVPSYSPLTSFPAASFIPHSSFPTHLEDHGYAKWWRRPGGPAADVRHPTDSPIPSNDPRPSGHPPQALGASSSNALERVTTAVGTTSHLLSHTQEEAHKASAAPRAVGPGAHDVGRRREDLHRFPKEASERHKNLDDERRCTENLTLKRRLQARGSTVRFTESVGAMSVHPLSRNHTPFTEKPSLVRYSVCRYGPQIGTGTDTYTPVVVREKYSQGQEWYHVTGNEQRVKTVPSQTLGKDRGSPHGKVEDDFSTTVLSSKSDWVRDTKTERPGCEGDDSSRIIKRSRGTDDFLFELNLCLNSPGTSPPSPSSGGGGPFSFSQVPRCSPQPSDVAGVAIKVEKKEDVSRATFQDLLQDGF